MKGHVVMASIAEVNGKAGRVSVSVENFYASGLSAEISAYMYSAEKDSYNLDPWTTIECIDRSVKGDKYFLGYGQSGEKTVIGNYKIYVAEQDFQKINTKLVQSFLTQEI